jgi:N-methylhydantoinase B
VVKRGAELRNYTERSIRKIIGEIPDGSYEFTDYLDDDGCGEQDIAITCLLKINDDTAEVDFSMSADQVRGPVNAVKAITASAVNYVFRCLAPGDLPSNGGVMRPVRLATRSGSIVDAIEPAAVAAGNVETSQRIVDVVLGALAKALPDRIPAASSGSMNNVTLGGVCPETGKVFAYYETVAGGLGAGPTLPGASAVHAHMTNTLNTPIEALEHAMPVLIEAYRIRRGSGGAGKHNGGDGIQRRFLFKAETEVTMLSERRLHQPYGLAGGGPGDSGCDILFSTDGSYRELPGKCVIMAQPGHTLEINTPGGGGWGKSSN